MRIELGWGVGSKAEKKLLKFFLWEAENCPSGHIHRALLWPLPGRP